MIKPVEEIPQSMAQKRESYRDRIRGDIREALVTNRRSEKLLDEESR